MKKMNKYVSLVRLSLRILPQQNTALLSHFRLCVCHRRDMSIYANIYTDFEH